MYIKPRLVKKYVLNVFQTVSNMLFFKLFKHNVLFLKKKNIDLYQPCIKRICITYTKFFIFYETIRSLLPTAHTVL